MSEFEDPHKQIDRVIKKKTQPVETVIGQSEQVQKVIDNLKFREEVKKNPVLKKHSVKAYGFETVDLNSYLNMRLWTRGIYTTDKLIRLGFGARLEFLTRYLKKKRHVPFNLLWLIIIMFGIVAGIIVVLVLLPKFI